MHEHRASILRKLMHSSGMSFNELWGKNGNSNKFAYHLKILEEDELVEKIEGKYCLSHKGKKYATYVDGISGNKTKFPLIGIICVIYDKAKNKYLMSRRLKEPFYGYYGFIGGKLEFSQYIYECAKKEIKEETGLECDLKLKGIWSSKTYNNSELSYNHQMFILLCTNPRGEFLEKMREGENVWLSEKEMFEHKLFSDIPHLLDIVKSKKFRWVEMDRIQKDDEFIDKKILRDVEF